MPLTLQIILTDEQIDAIARRANELQGKSTENALTIAQFAKAVGEGVSTIHAKVKAGVIIKGKNPGVTKIPHSELERYRNGGVPPKNP